MVAGAAACGRTSAVSERIQPAEEEMRVDGQQSVPEQGAIAPSLMREAAARSRGTVALADASDWNTEAYDRIYGNAFLAVAANPLSTFSIDVDRASYSNVRRFILGGQLPPKDAVRIEELINYFTYDYPQPVGDDPFSVTTELMTTPWNAQHKLVRIGLQGERIDSEQLPPSNLVFLIDVSGSMSSANKLPLLKSAFRLLVNELREDDRVAIVVYAGAAGLVLPPTSGDQKDRILDAIGALEAGGSTAGGAGLTLAYRQAMESFLVEGNNRVILATDGDFNVGPSSDAEMVRLIEERRDSGVFLTVLGFGTGNLKDSKMEKLADKGNGNYAYIDNLLEAKKVLVSELGGTLFTIAKDVKIQVEFNPEKVFAYRLIGYENRLLRNEDFADDTKDAGEIGAAHSVTALYEIVPVGAEATVEIQGLDSLRYQTVTRAPADRGDSELLFVKVRYKQRLHVRCCRC
jgi:Ca-activated chloride channel family protein